MEVFNVAYEEALKASGRTATELLNETIKLKYKVLPQYQIFPTPGRPRNKPEFTCKVTVRARPPESSSALLRTYIEEANSTRKKDAQHLAAILVLRQILPINMLQRFRKRKDPSSGGAPPKLGRTSSPPDSDFMSKIDPLDPKTIPPSIVNDLDLACCEKGLPSPKYEDLGQEGPCHCPVFTVRSWIPLNDGRELVEVVRAATKKDGRKIGSFRLLDRIAAIKNNNKIRISLSIEDKKKILDVLEQLGPNSLEGGYSDPVPSSSKGPERPSSESFKLKYERNKLANTRANARGHEVKPGSSLMVRNPVVDFRLKKELDRKWNSDFTSDYSEIIKARQRLPAYKAKADLLEVLEKNQVTVISGETGSGKTTQVGQFILEQCIEEGDGSVTNIICTQPRRISAITCSERVAKEMGEDLGESVGYSIRLENKLPRRSSGSLLYCTTGIILQRLKEDPTLSKVSHIIVDEVHERDILVDFLMALLKDLIIIRPDLKVILMSATLDAKKFQAYFPNAALFHIPGLTFPVTDYYLEDVIKLTRFIYPVDANRGSNKKFQDFISPYIRELQLSKKYGPMVLKQLSNPASENINFDIILSLLDHICKLEEDKSNNGILVFLPGWAEISDLYNLLQKSGRFPESRFLLIPLHSSLPTVNQREVFNRPPPGVRKIVISTNIAETSITIDDIVYVIDGGRMNVNNYDSDKNLETLDCEWVSRANAIQRRGRAGRTQPGICYHLFTKHRESVLEAAQKPEILRTSLEEVVLQIKSLGLGCAYIFLQKVMDAPEILSIKNVIDKLQGINALDHEEFLTPLGFHLSQLPMDPWTGKMIIYGALFSCLDPILSVAAWLSFQDPFYTPIGKEVEVNRVRKDYADGTNSDHIVMIRAIRGFEDAKNVGNEGSYCYTKFLSPTTLRMLIKFKGQFAQYLYKQGFLNSPYYKDGEYNRNSENVGLIIGIICGGLYPNLATWSNKTKTNKNKKKEKRQCISTQEDGCVAINRKSINAKNYCFQSPYFVYHKKKRVFSINLYDTTMVMPLHLAFFGGNFRMHSAGIEIEHKNILFKTKGGIYLMLLRQQMDRLLANKFENPGPVDWSEGSKEGALLATVIELITTEYNSIMHIRDKDDSKRITTGNLLSKIMDEKVKVTITPRPCQ